ncbi:GGDEF domain-containing protein [Frankia sp. Mgl5]|uniref:diguanylate cyclase domain-containing protein n=1 Tax=Frankia sp. Mgl5 TaxID=2933793 RepID=UPI00200E1723|nr:GGDEF domain-containing protein [Frankia sp. Mgl5]MCK9932923.1 GGDEF domain-containing protein [Frankia sp. Mgl5]
MGHSRRRDRLFRRAAVGAAVLTGACVVLAQVLPDSLALPAVRLTVIGFLLLGGTTCVVAGLRRHGAERWWRLLMAVMVLAVAVASAAVFRDTAAGRSPVPQLTPASLVYLIPLAMGVAGVLLYPTDPVEHDDAEDGGPLHAYRWYAITILDGMIVVGSVALLVWATVLKRTVGHGEPLGPGPLYSIILAAVSLVVFVVLILVAVFREPRDSRGHALLLAGMCAASISAMWELAVLIHSLDDVPRLTDLPIGIGALLIGLAAISTGPDTGAATGADADADADDVGVGLAAVPSLGRRAASARLRRWHAILPYLPLTAAGAATVLQIAGDGIEHWEEIWALLALLLLALVRQMMTMSDNIRLLGQVEEKQRQLRHQAFHDPLTGLANRSLFIDRLERVLHRQPGPAERFAVLFCDLDDFKRVNDVLGHAAGDDLLRITGARLAGCVRAADTVARLGGDEFAILLVSANTDDPEAVGRRLAAAVRAPVRLASHTFTVAASVGLVTVDPETGTGAPHRGANPAAEPDPDPDADVPDTAEQLLHRADLAMYAAKARRNGEPAVYTPELVGPGRARPALNVPLP